MDSAREEEFRAVAAIRMASLRRTAYALCGDWHAADDLVQVTLVKLFTAWPLRDPGAVDGWLRQAMVRAYVDITRRPWWRRERTVAELPDREASPESASSADDLLAQLELLPGAVREGYGPTGQIGILVHVDDLSIEAYAIGTAARPATFAQLLGVVDALRWQRADGR